MDLMNVHRVIHTIYSDILYMIKVVYVYPLNCMYLLNQNRAST